jgi:hypothetical protein
MDNFFTVKAKQGFISSIELLPSGFVVFCIIFAQLFLQVQVMPHREHSPPHFTFSGPCIVIYLLNEDQQTAIPLLLC